MFPRRSVPIPARSLTLEPVQPTPELSSAQLDNYVRNTDDPDSEEVPILRDLPFGQAPLGGEMPFHVGGGETPFDEGTFDGDTEGIPVGLPDLFAAAPPSSPTPEAPVLVAPPVAPAGFGAPVLAGVFVLGLFVGLGLGLVL